MVEVVVKSEAKVEEQEQFGSLVVAGTNGKGEDKKADKSRVRNENLSCYGGTI